MSRGRLPLEASGSIIFWVVVVGGGALLFGWGGMLEGLGAAGLFVLAAGAVVMALLWVFAPIIIGVCAIAYGVVKDDLKSLTLGVLLFFGWSLFQGVLLLLARHTRAGFSLLDWYRF